MFKWKIEEQRLRMCRKSECRMSALATDTEYTRHHGHSFGQLQKQQTYNVNYDKLKWKNASSLPYWFS